MRTGGSPIPFATSTTVDPQIPQFLSARYGVSTDTLRVDYDILLQPGPVDPTNWVINATAVEHVGIVALVSGSTIIVNPMTVSPGSMPDRIDYSPPPFDILGLAGGVAPAFAGLPLAVSP